MSISWLVGLIGAGVTGWLLAEYGVRVESGWRETAFVGACGFVVSTVIQMIGWAL